MLVVGLFGHAALCAGSCSANCDECTGTETYECTKCSSGYYLDLNINHDCVATCPSPSYANAETMNCDACTPGLSQCIIDGHHSSVSANPGYYTCYNASINLCCAAPGNGATQGQVCDGLNPEYSCCSGYKKNMCNKNAEQYCCTAENNDHGYGSVCALDQGCCGAWPSCFDRTTTQCCTNHPSTYGQTCQVSQLCNATSSSCSDCPAGTFGNTTSQTCETPQPSAPGTQPPSPADIATPTAAPSSAPSQVKSGDEKSGAYRNGVTLFVFFLGAVVLF